MSSLSETLGLPYGKHTGPDIERRAVDEIERLRRELADVSQRGQSDTPAATEHL